MLKLNTSSLSPSSSFRRCHKETRNVWHSSVWFNHTSKYTEPITGKPQSWLVHGLELHMALILQCSSSNSLFKYFPPSPQRNLMFPRTNVSSISLYHSLMLMHLYSFPLKSSFPSFFPFFSSRPHASTLFFNSSSGGTLSPSVSHP